VNILNPGQFAEVNVYCNKNFSLVKAVDASKNVDGFHFINCKRKTQ
jgi:hypothetical protein